MATGFPVKANYATGDVLTAANMNDLSGTVNYLQYMPPRNSVLNSAMNVWQRGTSISVPASTAVYTADRWAAYGGANACTVSRQATNDTTNLPNIQYCARVQRNSGQTSLNGVTFVQSMETVNSIPFAGKQVTLSFYARAGANFSAASNILSYYVISGTGTDQNRINGAYTGDNASISATTSLTTTWQRITLTGTLPATATELAVYFIYTPTGTAGAADYFEITGVQLELGSAANTYMPNQPTYQGELAACQRYYNRVGNSLGNAAQRLGIGPATATTNASVTFYLPVNLRTATTSIDYSGLQLYEGTTTYAVTSAAVNGQSTQNPNVNLGVASGITAGKFYEALTTSTSGYIAFNAEL